MGIIIRRDLATASSQLASRESTPKIAGSVGGFIALVIGLILVIVIACTAIFFLLRQEAAEGTRTRHGRNLPVPSSYSYRSSPNRSWFASLQGLFSDINGKKSRDGWVQAAGDEWDHNLDSPQRMRNMGDTQYRAVDPPFRPPGIPAPESSLAVHYEPHTSDFRIPNRFASSSPSPSGSPVSSPRNLPPVTLPRSASPESVSPPQSTSSVYIEPDNRENSAKSDVSTRTFDSGTKFYEGL